MKKLILIVIFFVSQFGFGQYYTFQVFGNSNELYVYNSSTNSYQFAQPFHDFLVEYGSYNSNIAGATLPFNDDPGDLILPMYVVAEQANNLENLLSESDLVLKYIRHDAETPFLLDRLWFRYFVDMVPQFLGINEGVVQTDFEPLNLIFEEFQVDNYAQSFPNSTNPFLLSVHQIRCNSCDVFELVQALSTIQIIELAELVEYEGIILNINETELLNQFSIYPNPNNGNFEILLNSNELTGTTLVIFDALGRKVQVEKITQFQTTIRLDGIRTGLYFAQPLVCRVV